MHKSHLPSFFATIHFCFEQGFLIKILGAAHRNIKFNIAVRCTFKTRKHIIATNIAVRCTFYKKTL
jgi:hypothetical protein